MKLVTILIVLLGGLLVINSSMYVVPEGQQAVVTQFGRPVKSVTEAGLQFKTPFIQEVHRIEKRLLPWDGEPQDMPTRDKRRIAIDVWARWRIVDPMKFYKVVGTQRSAQQRLDEAVDSAIRAVIAKNNLIDAVRTSDKALEYESKELEKDWSERRERVATGRRMIEKETQEVASRGLEELYVFPSRSFSSCFSAVCWSSTPPCMSFPRVSRRWSRSSAGR